MAFSEPTPSGRLVRDLLCRLIPWLVLAMVVTTGVAGFAGIAAYRRAAGIPTYLEAMWAYRWIILTTILAEGGFLFAGIVVVVRLARRIGTLSDEQQCLVRAVLHDLRTPLGLIRNEAENLARGTADVQFAAGSIAEHCGRLLDVVEMNAEISLNLTACAQPAAPLDFAETLAMATDLFSSVAQEAGVGLSYAPPAGRVMVGLHPARAQRLMANLLDNAIKFTPRGGEVRVSLDVAGDRVVLEVADTGIGMDAETQARMYERFYRADPSRHTPGFGLGLALVRTIVEQARGRIVCRSALGKGTVFIVTLPHGGG